MIYNMDVKPRWKRQINPVVALYLHMQKCLVTKVILYYTSQCAF